MLRLKAVCLLFFLGGIGWTGCRPSGNSPSVQTDTVITAFPELPVADTAGVYQFIADPKRHSIQLFWKNEKGERYGSLQHLESQLASQGRKLLMAMNGGMFREDFSPVGLYIEEGKQVRKLVTNKGSGNFYLLPNGVFYLTDSGKAVVCTTPQFRKDGHIRYATQSGPMLVIDSQIHPGFNAASQNKNIRNGVGILPDGRVLFAMSKVLITFYDFAGFFRKAGCRNALYLDGFISQIYLPHEGIRPVMGDFGVMIGVTVREETGDP